MSAAEAKESLGKYKVIKSNIMQTAIVQHILVKDKDLAEQLRKNSVWRRLCKIEQYSTVTLLNAVAI